MFFDRTGLTSSASHPAGTGTAKQQQQSLTDEGDMYSRKRRRQLAALGLAAAMAAPLVVMGGWSATAAEENSGATDAASDAAADADVSQSIALAEQKEASISAVLEALAQAGVTRPVRCLALPDRPIEHGNPDAQRAEEGLDVAGIARALRELAQRS